jgi:hypothetical protein
MDRSVLEAFLASGALKACTPLEIASVPVRAVQPFENAASMRKNVESLRVVTLGYLYARRPPVRPNRRRRYMRSARRPIINRNEIMNTYVGSAKESPIL